MLKEQPAPIDKATLRRWCMQEKWWHLIDGAKEVKESLIEKRKSLVILMLAGSVLANTKSAEGVEWSLEKLGDGLVQNTLDLAVEIAPDNQPRLSRITPISRVYMYEALKKLQNEGKLPGDKVKVHILTKQGETLCPIEVNVGNLDILLTGKLEPRIVDAADRYLAMIGSACKWDTKKMKEMRSKLFELERPNPYQVTTGDRAIEGRIASAEFIQKQ